MPPKTNEDWKVSFRKQFMQPGAIDMDLQNLIDWIDKEKAEAVAEARREAEEKGWRAGLEWVKLILSYKHPLKVKQLIEEDLALTPPTN